VGPRLSARLAAALPLLILLLSDAPVLAAGWMRLSLPDGGHMLAEVMEAPAERAQGLMFRDGLPPGRLMLFFYTEDAERRLWMKNCRFPIDVAWVAADGGVVAVRRGLPPCGQDPCPQYTPGVPARHFIEGPAGWLAAHGVAVGGRIGLGERTAGQ
jgi:uncharacterized membrane protein (UPF0127 family)